MAEAHVHELEMLAVGVEEEGEERGRIPYALVSSAWERNRKSPAAKREARVEDTQSREAKWKW